MLSKRGLFLATGILLCFIAAFLYFYATPYGVGLTNDSAAYLGGARSISDGLGYARISGDKLPRLITHFPPMYSLVISGVSLIGKIDVFRSAWVINFICYILNLILFALLLRIITRQNIAAVFAGICYLCCGPVLQTHIYGLSEAIFLTFFLLSLIIIYENVRDEKSIGYWILLGLIISILTLIRYIGVAAFLAAILFSVFTLPSARRRIEAVTGTILGTILPVSIWMVRNYQAGENAVNRVLAWHWPAPDKIHEGLVNISGFFLPEFGGFVEKFLNFWGILLLLVFSGLLVWIFITFYHNFRNKSNNVSGSILIAIQAVTYFVSVIFVVICIDGSTLFDNRIFMPLYVCLTALILYAAISFFKGKNLSAISGILIIFAFSALLFEDESDLIKTYHQDGQGFASQDWLESEIRSASSLLPEGAEFFSNRQTFLWLMNNQPSYILPPMFNAANQEERNSFESEKEWMQEEVLKGNAYVIIFNYQEMMDNREDSEWLGLLLDGLPVYKKFTDGAIFGIPPVGNEN
ncbi:MAG: glycosyltransferase family 39 protein [Flexilinea sp.]